MIPAHLLAGVLFALAGPAEGDAPAPAWPEIPEECRGSAEALAGAAEDLLARAGPHPEAGRLERARQMYRRARLLSPAPDLSLRAADLAAAAGDEEESGDLLSEAAETSPGRLSAADRWTLLRRAEGRREWREAMLHANVLRDLHAEGAEAVTWLDGTLQRLEVAIEAEAIASPPLVRPPEAARRALAQGRRALGGGDLARARERLGLALRLAPGYVEAALALGALEAREGRTPDAIRAFRAALAAEPNRFEALVGLARILWDEPDRAAKRESLALLDRAVAARPDAVAVARLAATRWAEWGDAEAALERLEAFRERATPQDRRETDALRDALVRRLRSGRPADPDAAAGAGMPELSSPALEEWKIAQVYFRRGDPASLEAALARLEEAERADPGFARAPELAGAIHERRGETALAEAAYRRSIRADPTRAAPHERIALLLGRDPQRAGEAEAMWRSAEGAGSGEALFHLAAAAEGGGRAGAAVELYRRYLRESAGGLHSEDAARAAARLEAARARRALWGGIAGGILLAGSVGVLYRRRTGRTLEEWLRRSPSRAREVRPIAGRLRHEVLKHGRLLLADAAGRLREEDYEARRRVAELLLSRLYDPGGPGGRLGLVAEAEDALSRLAGLARLDGERLNARRDRFLSPVAGAAALLRRTEAPLKEISRDPDSLDAGEVARVAGALERAAALFGEANAAELMRVIDRASSISVSLPAFRELFDRLSQESRVTAPALEALGLLSDPAEEVRVRIDRADWETIWRNLFANAAGSRNGRSGDPLRIAVGAERLRDTATGAAIARFVFADNIAAPLSGDTLRESAADRGWGVVAELLRRHDGQATVAPAPSAAYSKGIVLELPAPEPEAAG